MNKPRTSGIMFIVMLLTFFTAIAFTTLSGSAEEYYEVRIEYLNSDGTERIHDPYVALFPAGSNVNVMVTNPVIPGYKPSTTPDGDDTAITTSLSFPSLLENSEFNVYYLPDLVHYKVRFFKQNIRDDQYTEDLSLSQSEYERTGLTGEYPAELENKSFEGFTSLFHEPDVIAADGSTIFKVYYDRNYYLINFDLDGGYGVEPVYAKYQSRYNIPEPTKPGYVFMGWALSDGHGNFIDENGSVIGEEDVVPEKFTSGVVPAGNQTYKAVWQAGESSYSIVYWVENADNDGYSVIAAKDMKTYRDNAKVMSGDLIDCHDRNEVPNFFSDYNWNAQTVDPDTGEHAVNESGEPVDNQGNVVDFPDMSPGQRKELNGHSKYFIYNAEKSDSQKEVMGDGTTRINVYYDRARFTQRFIYARSRVDSNGRTVFQLAGPTKGFSSKKDQTLDRHLLTKNSDTTVWMDAAEKPVLKDEYKQLFYEKSDIRVNTDNYPTDMTAHIGVCTYYYLETKEPVKYYADMSSVWKLDAFSPVEMVENKSHNPKVPAGAQATFGAWSVEAGTLYADTHSNRTVKGVYEKLDDELMRTDNRSNDTELYYLAFWTSTYSMSWNTSAYQYQFDYEYYVEALPGTPENELYDGAKPANSSEKNFILHNSVTTFDGGDQYKDKRTRDSSIKSNQTPAGLTGFELIGFRTQPSGKNKGSVVLDDDNCIINWIDDNHAVIKFFYRRLHYNLKFRNDNIKDESKTRVLYYDQSLSGSDMNGDPIFFVPEYPFPDLARYYTFGGWYDDPKHNNKLAMNEDGTDFAEGVKMPADDDTLYALWIPQTENVTFYSDYAQLAADEPLYQKGVPYNTIMATQDIPTANPDDQTGRVKVTKPYANSTFAGWYYISDGVPVRFDPENMPVTHPMKLYAEWVSTDTASYRLRFVEKDDHDTDVASPISGTAFISKTKTFQAKGGAELNEAHKWVDGEINWWPVYRSTSILVEPNDGEGYAPNEKVIEYIQKDKVWYRVQYLDAVTREPLSAETVSYINKASVTEKAPYIEGYIADRVTKTIVLSASSLTDQTAAQAEELAQNTIVFYYTKNDKDALYQVNFMEQNIDSDDASDRSQYSLYMNDTLTVPLNSGISFREFQNHEYARALVNAGFEFVPELTSVEGEVGIADHDGSDLTADGHAMIVSLYYKRVKYGYSYNLVDYAQESLYNAELEKPEEERDQDIISAGNGVLRTVSSEDFRDYVGRTVPVTPDTQITVDGVKYTRVSDRELSMMIRPDESLNTINVYYIRQERYTLQFKPYCVISTDDDYAAVTKSLVFAQTVDDLSEVTVIERMADKYTFMGWYENPDMLHAPVSRDNTFTPSMPTANTTYYAVFVPKYLDPTVLYAYSNDYGQTWIRSDGSVSYRKASTGLSAEFADPTDVTYIGNGASTKRIAYNSQVELTARADEWSHYEFIGWYDGDGNKFSADPDTTLTVDDNKEYIAYFRKEMVSADVSILCTDSGAYDPDGAGSAQDDDGSLTGYEAVFDSPEGYINKVGISYDEGGVFRFRLVQKPEAEGKLHKYVFSGWYKISGDAAEEVSGGVETVIEEPTTASVKYVAVFEKADDIPYQIDYRFLPRGESDPANFKTFVKKGSLTSENMAESITGGLDTIELSDSFVLKNAPYESNYGETLEWDAGDIVKTYSDGVVRAAITARQSVRSVTVNYRLSDKVPYGEPIVTFYGANRKLDSQLVELDLRGNDSFSYWAIRKSADKNAPVIAKCADPWFSFCIIDDYWITPVFEDGSKAEETKVTLTHLEDTRNRWTDADGNLNPNGRTDLLYTDFEIAYDDKGRNIFGENSGYRTGVVFELCAQMTAEDPFDPGKSDDYEALYASNEANLKAAVAANVKPSKYVINDETGKQRSIMISQIATEKLTNKNRIEFGKPFANAYKIKDGEKAYTNSTYLMKATAYLIDPDGNVTLSNHVFVCLSEVAAKELSYGS